MLRRKPSVFTGLLIAIGLLGGGGAPGRSCAQCTDPALTNECAPGGGSKLTECQMEWRYTPVPRGLANKTPTPDVKYIRFRPYESRKAVQWNRIVCYEGDQRCDFDPDLNNASCTFRTKICINNQDPRYPLCPGTVYGGVPLDTFEVLEPRPGNYTLTSSQNANIAALENEGAGLGLTVVRKNTVQILGGQNPSPDQCGGLVDLVVPLSTNSSGQVLAAEERFHIRSTNTMNKRDADKLRLICRPSTCGDGIVDEDHELCDDGNRSNCDLCDQGCQPNTSPTCTSTPTPPPTETPTQTPTDTPTETPTDTPTP